MKMTTIAKYNKYLEEDCISNGTNPLTIGVIHKEKWYDLKAKLFNHGYMRFLREYYTPSFEFLTAVCDFIITMENLCLYSNDKSNTIFAYRNMKQNTCSFCIANIPISIINNDNDFSTYSIEYTMYGADHKINITIRRDWGDKVRTNITFVAGEPMLLNETDQVLFDSIISNTMYSVVSVYRQCREIIEPIKLNHQECPDSFTHS